MKAHYYTARKKRQRRQKSAKLHQYYAENLLDTYTLGHKDSMAYGILARYAFNTESAPEKAAPPPPQDGLWLTDDNAPAKDFKETAEKIAQKEKAEKSVTQPPTRRVIGISF